MKIDLSQVPHYKPADICYVDPSVSQLKEEEQILHFAEKSMAKLEEKVSGLGYQLCMADEADFQGISALEKANFSDPLGKQVILLALLYGHSAVIKNSEGNIVGSTLISSFNNPEKTSFGNSLAIDSTASGNHLSADLATYTSWAARIAGQRIKRGTVHPKNLAGLKNYLNRVGYYCEMYDPEFYGKGKPRFHITCSLSPAGISNNAIDLSKVNSFIQTKKEGDDYLIIANNDLDRVNEVYKTTAFKIVAFLPAGTVNDNSNFLLTKMEQGA
jgi:hypothetical protein